MTAYYNEHDKFAAAWLRELIKDNLIAPGEVDERDIQDVRPDELRSFRQCHFFAGIGGWSLALRTAGWPDDRQAWTASCPCQPFSAAGQGGGFADERHLWPAFYHLATQCGPDVVLGEQTASKDGLAWIDLVSSDMEAAGYAGGAVDLCSAGFGAPNLRQRLYLVWLADANGAGLAIRSRAAIGRGIIRHEGQAAPARRLFGGLGHAMRYGARPAAGNGKGPETSQGGCHGRLAGRQPSPGLAGEAGGLAYPNGRHSRAEGLQRGGKHRQRTQDAGNRPDGFSGATKGFWRDADWILCRDDDGPAWRPVERGSFPLAPSIPGRVALLRGAGNAINVEVAAGFVEEVMAVLEIDRQRQAA